MKKPGRAATRRSRAQGGRSWARRFALQALYQWQKTGQGLDAIENQFIGELSLHKALKNWLQYAVRTRDYNHRLLALIEKNELPPQDEGDLSTAKALLKRQLGDRVRQGYSIERLQTALDDIAFHSVIRLTDPRMLEGLLCEVVLDSHRQMLEQELVSRQLAPAVSGYLNRVSKQPLVGIRPVKIDDEWVKDQVEQLTLINSRILEADSSYFKELLHGVPASIPASEKVLGPFLDRPFEQLDPVEKIILWLSGYELQHRTDIPYKVVINEAVELAKAFGAEQGHRFVNGVLDKAARVWRTGEPGHR